MCAVSAVMDYGMRMPDDFWNRQTYRQFVQIVDQAKKFDDATGQPHCEDPNKIALLQRIEERLARIEKRVGLADGITQAD